MRTPYTQLYLHLVWSTWDRLPLISEQIESRLYAAIATKCLELHCKPLAIGGIADHVHLLVLLHPAISISELVKEVKGSTSHLITHEIMPGEFFKWQGAYGAFTLRKKGAPVVKAYIERQKLHHAENSMFVEWERSFEESKEDSG